MSDPRPAVDITSLRLLTLALLQEGPTDESLCTVWTSFTYAMANTTGNQRELMHCLADAWGFVDDFQFDTACKRAYLNVTPMHKRDKFFTPNLEG